MTPSLPEMTESSNKPEVKGAKSDDAEVPAHLWDRQIFPVDYNSCQLMLGALQWFALAWWRRRVKNEFLNWFKQSFQHLSSKSWSFELGPKCIVFNLKVKDINKDLLGSSNWIAGRECVQRCANATWWDWDDSSRALFWRWSDEYRPVI